MKWTEIAKNSHSIAWENEKGHKIFASEAYTTTGRKTYWTVDFIIEPGNFKKLGTRCTWEKVMQFLAEYENK